MRRMSFALTTPAVRARSKFVTRRVGWLFATAGTRVLAVDKLRIKSAELLAVIEVVNVRREPLNAIESEGPNGTRLEGLPDLTPSEFVDMLCAAGGMKPGDLVTRIEFKYVGAEDCDYCHGRGISFGHTPACTSEHCALAAGYDDCAGELQPCACTERSAA